MSEPLFVGRWITCSDRMPKENGFYSVRMNDGDGKQFPGMRAVEWAAGRWFPGLYMWAVTHWLEPFSLATDEAFISALADAISDAWKPGWPNSHVIAKAALAAAVKGTP